MLIDKGISDFFKLSEKEKEIFRDIIKKYRKKNISTPSVAASRVFQMHKSVIDGFIKGHQISQAIIAAREFVYEEFLKEESGFNGSVLGLISREFEIPKSIVSEITKNIYLLKTSDIDEFRECVIDCFGNYAGKISPYIYELCLSNTQSRRSRAGKTFESIIYKFYNDLGYTFDAQKKIGKIGFAELGLGKVVDSILPSAEHFKMRRNKTIIGTMKTTLRERWQEVVEEIARSNIPNIHLLTVDVDIPVSKAVQMAKHNIVLVVLLDVKQEDKIKSMHSIISFEDYFYKELPEIFSYWKNYEIESKNS